MRAQFRFAITSFSVVPTRAKQLKARGQPFEVGQDDVRHEKSLREQVPSERLRLLAAEQVQVLQEAVHCTHRLEAEEGKRKMFPTTHTHTKDRVRSSVIKVC